MHTEHLFARWMEPNSSSWANPAVKTVPFALSGCVPNPCSAAQNAFAAVKHLAPHPPTANACTLILARTFDFTPVFPEIPLTGTIYTGTELSLSAPLT